MLERGVVGVVAAAAWAMFACAHGDTYYVDGTDGNDGNDGSLDYPFKTIQRALDLGSDTLGGDGEIVVKPGTYHLGGTPLVKNLYCTLRSESGNPADTIIDADGDSYCARFVGAAGSKAKIPFRVSGFTFMNGMAPYQSGTIACCGVVAEVNVVISNCVVTACGSEDLAYFPVELRDATMVDCVISNCTVKQAASALRLNEGGVFRNGLITGCRVASGTFGAVFAYAGGTLRDTVLSNNVGVTTACLSGVPDELAGCTLVDNNITMSSRMADCGTVVITTNATKIADIPAITLITNCVIAGNTVSSVNYATCSGLSIDGLPCRVVGCVITNNISRNYTGVYAKAGSGTVLEECLIADNTAQYASGGGAYLGDGVVARNCRFIGNMAENQAAGGIYAKGCTLSGCLISNNVAKCGGGVCVVTDDIAATIVGCRFIDNEASFAGGGLHVGFIYNVSNSDGTEGYANVADCIFVKNRANADSSTSGSYYGGGAVALRTGDISAGLFDRCVFADNETAGYGGAFTLRTSENSEHGKALVAVRNSLFTGNRAITGGTSKRYGGAMYLTSGDPVMVENCTFSGNEDASLNAGTAGNDDVCVRWSGVRVRNCIFATPRFETNDIYKTACETNGFVGTGLPNNRVLASKGNFAVADAKFADAANGDFSLRQDSPFVNVAATLGWMTDLSRDLAGNKRISSNGPDIGAYECQIPIGLRVMIR